MKKMLTLREIQEEQLKILNNLIVFLEKNNLKYYICGGTLLGAIRHKGFIPWDDDIDIFMPRPDFEKLLNLYKDSKDYYLASSENNKIDLPFAKVFYKKIKINQYRIKKSKNDYLWIDIFPLDGIEEDNQKSDKLFRKQQFLKKCIGLSNTKTSALFKEWKKPKKFLIKLVMKIYVSIVPKKHFVNKINSICKSKDYLSSKYVGNMAWALGKKEKLLKNKIEKTKKYQFENIYVNGIKEYDYYLKKIYGDYMTIPPKDKRANHDFEAWIDYEK